MSETGQLELDTKQRAKRQTDSFECCLFAFSPIRWSTRIVRRLCNRIGTQKTKNESLLFFVNIVQGHMYIISRDILCAVSHWNDRTQESLGEITVSEGFMLVFPIDHRRVSNVSLSFFLISIVSFSNASTFFIDRQKTWLGYRVDIWPAFFMRRRWDTHEKSFSLCMAQSFKRRDPSFAKTRDFTTI